MRLLRRSTTSVGTPETLNDREAAERQALRIRAARSVRVWTEVDGSKLEPRGPRRLGYLVDPGTDAAFTRYAGCAISPGGGLVSDMTPLHWYVDEAGEPRFLVRESRSWSEISARL